MALFFPTQLKNNITEITADDLRTLGASAVLLDIDNTLTLHDSPVVPQTVREWLDTRKAEGVAMILVSNNRAERVQPFAEQVGLPFVSRAKKPLPSGYRRAASELGVPLTACVVVGDQVFTDILGANLCGISSVQLLPLAPEEHQPFIAFKRLLERPVLAAYRRRQRRNEK